MRQEIGPFHCDDYIATHGTLAVEDIEGYQLVIGKYAPLEIFKKMESHFTFFSIFHHVHMDENANKISIESSGGDYSPTVCVIDSSLSPSPVWLDK
jgi:hypothetical protein